MNMGMDINDAATGNRPVRKRNTAWKAITAVLCAAVLILSGVCIYLNVRISTLSGQIRGEDGNATVTPAIETYVSEKTEELRTELNESQRELAEEMSAQIQQIENRIGAAQTSSDGI